MWAPCISAYRSHKSDTMLVHVKGSYALCSCVGIVWEFFYYLWGGKNNSLIANGGQNDKYIPKLFPDWKWKELHSLPFALFILHIRYSSSLFIPVVGQNGTKWFDCPSGFACVLLSARLRSSFLSTMTHACRRMDFCEITVRKGRVVVLVIKESFLLSIFDWWIISSYGRMPKAFRYQTVIAHPVIIVRLLYRHIKVKVTASNTLHLLPVPP